jgi:hypothetical protein
MRSCLNRGAARRIHPGRNAAVVVTAPGRSEQAGETRAAAPCPRILPASPPSAERRAIVDSSPMRGARGSVRSTSRVGPGPRRVRALAYASLRAALAGYAGSRPHQRFLQPSSLALGPGAIAPLDLKVSGGRSRATTVEGRRRRGNACYGTGCSGWFRPCSCGRIRAQRRGLHRLWTTPAGVLRSHFTGKPSPRVPKACARWPRSS